MNLEDYEEIECNVQDVRFGLINIYMNKEDNQSLVMEKSRKSISLEDHEFNCLQAEQRLAIENESLLKMLGTTRDDENWVTCSYFVYPNEDLFDKREELVNPIESMKFLTHMLEALTYLQDRRFLHGDLRPEYVFYDSRTDRYILLDRLGDPTNYTESQRNSLVYEDKTIFMSPEMFEQLSQNDEEVKHNPFKSECFSLGMVLLSMYTDELDLSLCYNRVEKVFDWTHFNIICEDLKRHFFVGKIEEMISSFLFEYILNLDCKKRCSPRKTLKVLSNKVAPKILKELENRRIRMGWDREDEIIPIDEEEPSSTMNDSEYDNSKINNSLDDEIPKKVKLFISEASNDLKNLNDSSDSKNNSKFLNINETKKENFFNKKEEANSILENDSLILIKETLDSDIRIENSGKNIKKLSDKERKESQESCELTTKEKMLPFFGGEYRLIKLIKS